MVATPTTNSTRLAGLKVAVDVQHLYRPHKPRDQGAEFVLRDGTRITEAAGVLQYAAALVLALEAWGAMVLRNNPQTKTLFGHYSTRNREANGWDADAYLACHLNAGRGSYAAMEHLAGTAGALLGDELGRRLTTVFPEILNAKTVPLVRGQRGAVCVQECKPWVAAVIVEPFFGDNPAHQSLLAPARLKLLGETLAEGVARWWERHGATRTVASRIDGTP